MRTISLRQPLAHALLVQGSGVIGKWHRWEDERLGLQCSTQVGCSRDAVSNEVLRDRLLKATLLPSIREAAPPPRGFVFASCRVLACVAADSVEANTVDALYACAALRLCRPDILAWVSLRPDSRYFYVLTEVCECKPVRWRGVMSCFPVPDEVFK